jgi:quercetin dioxygenase-like cupin family protein
VKVPGFAVAALLLAGGQNAPVREIRMTPLEATSRGRGDSQIGSSRLAGVHTSILAGDPSAAGFYSILLFVPAHTTIQAHSHRDHRMATVVSGAWQFGYGTRFEEGSLKALPVGSVYSEPGGINHFARTTDTPVVVHICGFGPTDTRYFESANDPALKRNQR